MVQVTVRIRSGSASVAVKVTAPSVERAFGAVGARSPSVVSSKESGGASRPVPASKAA